MENTEPPSQTSELTHDAGVSIPLSSAFPYEISTAATTTSSIILRRLTSLGTGTALVYLVHPLPQLFPLVANNMPSQPYLFLAQAIDTLFSTVLTVVVMFASFHLALYEGSVTFRQGKTLELKWLMMGVSAVLAFATTVEEETWIKTNLLWDLVAVVGVCGWLASSKEERRGVGLWVAGIGLGRIGWQVWGR